MHVQLEGKLRHLPAYLIRGIVALAGLSAFWTVLSMAPERIGYAGELEWMEGGVLGHVLRVSEGKPIYVEPSVDFTPYIYTPFYYWLCAALGSIFGLSTGLLRLVSLLSFVGSCALIVLFVWRRSRTYLPGIIGAGIFAATFRLGGAWFDIARGDSFLVFLLLLSATCLFCFEGKRSAIAAGVFLALSFLTKQSAAVPLAGLVGWAILTREARLLWFAGVASSIVSISWLVLHLTSDGWFTYYVFSLPARHPLLDDWKLLFWKEDVLGVLAIASFLLAFESYSQIEPTKKNFLRSAGFPIFVLGLTGQVWSSRFHLGMYDNVLMPLHALLGLGVGLALARLRETTRYSRAIEMVSLVALLGTFWKLEYPVEAQLPGSARVKQYENLMERLDQLPDETWVAFHSTPAIQQDKPPRAHWMALVDVIRGGGREAQLLRESARKWLSDRTAPAIVWSIRDSSDEWFRKEMQIFYRRSARLHGPPPLTGWNQRPTEIWVPRSTERQQRPNHRKAKPARREANEP